MAVKSQLSWTLHGPILHLLDREPRLADHCDWYYGCGPPPKAECKVHAYGSLAPRVTVGDVRHGSVKFGHLNVLLCGGCVKAFLDWERRGASMPASSGGGEAPPSGKPGADKRSLDAAPESAPAGWN